MKIFKKMAFVALSTIALISCSEDDTTNETVASTLTLKFDHSVKVGETINDAQDNVVTIDKLRYFVTDVTLVKEDGSEDVLPNDDAATIVELSEATDGVFSKTISNVTEGVYTSLKFTIGVSEEIYDLGEESQGSLLSLALEEESDGQDMFWAWASGYVYLKLQGSYPDADVEGGEGSVWAHIGNTGSGETRTDRVMEVTVDFHGEEINIENTEASIHLAVDVESLLNGTNKIDVTTAGQTLGDLITSNVENDVFSFHHQH